MHKEESPWYLSKRDILTFQASPNKRQAFTEVSDNVEITLSGKA
jgi:hypothetical protein